MERVRVRVLTDKYAALRKRYRAGRPPPLSGEEKANLLQGDEMHEMEAGSAAAGDSPPAWTRLLEDMNQVLAQIRRKLEQELSALHAKSALPTFSAEGTDPDAQIEQCGREISQLFISLSNGLRRLNQLQSRAANAEDEKALRNVQSTMTMQVAEVQRTYREMQRKYVTKLEARKRKSQSHLTTSAEAREWDEQEMGRANEAAQLVQAAQLDSATEGTLQILRQEITERDQCAREVVQQLSEVQSLFMDFDEKLVEQGTMLDRIDTQLVNTHESIVKAVKELRKVEEHQKRSTFTILVMLLCVLIVIFAIAVFVKMV
eukprot:TRINITY_DN47731_c0_g1_i1.p1 TRINITY_DN47731_c0_g1~~TRINITY_DN47731_c0_g1_i1.p1  ORF type:complete len:317 (+),score=95.41 TRINITY_DN47731_c0_g1_i1:57-1007(+)